MRNIFCCILTFVIYPVFSQKGFSIIEDIANKKTEVKYDGKLLTAYCYFDSTEKPILFPLKTLSGVTVTRGYPIIPRPGERTDHPHQVGLWMNYESVNGLDFWNNSFAIPPEKKSLYGSIRHQKILSSTGKNDHATLETLSHWEDQSGKVLIEETTRFVFSKKNNDFIIDRIATLEAKSQDVLFKDVKDGMLGIRVARQLEMPSQQADKFVDGQGIITAIPQLNNEGVTGMYLNKEGLKGDNVWGKRSAWTVLQGMMGGENVAIVIIDHPRNIGYPTYWHARGYGLFAANPLGQKIFSEGKEELNFNLIKGEKITFRYRIIIHNGRELSSEQINKLANEFVKMKN